MALQTSGQIRLNEIHVEAGGTSGTQTSMNAADNRGLIGAASGSQMKMTDWYGASNTFWEQPYWALAGGTPTDGSFWLRSLAGPYDWWDDDYYSSTKTIDLGISSNSFTNTAISIATGFGDQSGNTFTITGNLQLPTFTRPTQYLIVRGYTTGFLSGSSFDYILLQNNTGGITPVNQTFTVNAVYRHLIVAFEIHAAFPSGNPRGQFIDFKLS